MSERPGGRLSTRIILAAAVVLVLIAPVVARVSASRGQAVTGAGTRVEALAE